ncbi:MAG: SDR family oxidoreductase [Anaerolineae bacterium]|nr:SDR family oxidoreductase [Anaerolineae bacterium]
MQRILITGSNRGIGLELVRRYLRREDTLIFATCRNPQAAAPLQALAAQHPHRLLILRLEVTDAGQIVEAVTAVRIKVDGLDLLINNAGTYAGRVGDADPQVTQFGALEVGPMLDMLRVNTVAPLMMAQAFADLLRRGHNPRLVNVSSDAGSLTMWDGGAYTYPASKTALNMFTRCLAHDLRADGITVISLHPGFIQTDMGGPRATLTLDEAIPGVIRVIDNLAPGDSGQFLNWDGSRVPW